VQVVPSLTHYFLARVGDAEALRERLLVRHRVLVRSGRSFGLAGYIRVAGCGESERQRALAALREAL
jgi:histidinol-phosphate/aromatic aminotransferase/cobyric acid decarboxylase-like protein